jgi:hypothetical protein
MRIGRPDRALPLAASLTLLPSPPRRLPTRSPSSARKLFRGSLLYLPLLLAALAVHRQPNTHEDAAAVESRLRLQWEAAKARLAPLGTAARSVVPQAPDMRLRTVEERLGWIEQLRWQVARRVEDIKCPSRVFADEGVQVEEEEEAAAGGDRSSSGSGSCGGGSNTTASSSSSSSSKQQQHSQP